MIDMEIYMVGEYFGGGGGQKMSMQPMSLTEVEMEVDI